MDALLRSLVLVTLLAVQARGGLAQGGGAGILPRRSVVAGVLVLEHGPRAFDRAPRSTLEPRPVMVAGGASGGVDYDLTWVNSVVLLPDQRLATFATVGSRLLIFARDGRGERVIGRQGEGPGEFMRASGLVSLGGDTLLLADAATLRFNWIIPDAGVVATRAALNAFHSGESPAGVLPGGRLVLSSAGIVGRQPPRSEALVTVASLTGDTAREVARIPDLELVMVETRYRGRVRNLAQPLQLTRRASIVVWDTVIAVATGDGYRIDLLSSSGKTVGSIRMDRARRAVTAAMRDSVIARELRRFDGPHREPPVDPAETRRLIRAAPFADSLPPYEGLFVTPDHRLWVVDPIAPTDAGWSATAFRADGAIVARLEVPERSHPMAFGNDRVVVRTEDTDGVVALKVYRIVRAMAVP